MKEKKSKKPVLTINGFKDDKDILWKKLKCICAQDPKDVEHRWPMLKTCKFCKYTDCEKSVPREPYYVMTQKFNAKGEKVGKAESVLITEITIDRGSDDDIRGYIQNVPQV